MLDLKWMDEPVDKARKSNWIYKVLCFFMGRKLTYEELFIILKRTNENVLGNKESERCSFDEIVKTYEFNNNKIPEGIEVNES